MDRALDPGAFLDLALDLRRGGRVVECTALEMRSTRKGTVGSNPTLSAISVPEWALNLRVYPKDGGTEAF